MLYGEQLRNILKIFLLGSLFSGEALANINFASQNSRLSVTGGTCVFGNAIDNWNGTLEVLSGGSVSGSIIGFSRGNYTTSASSGILTGKFNPAGNKQILLNGSQRFNADASLVVPAMFVGGTANILEGQPTCLAPITLNTNAAELQLNVNNKLTSNIVMNGGSVKLLNNLALGDDVLLSGSGTVNFNKKSLSLPGKNSTWSDKLIFYNAADIALNAKTTLSGTWTFSGTTGVLNGNGNILDLSAGGTLWIAADQDIQFTDVHIKGLGATKGSLIFDNTAARLRLTNASLQLSESYTLSVGGLYFEGANCSIITGANTLYLGTNFSVTVDNVTVFGDTLDATSTVNVSPNIPDNKKLTYSNNGILRSIANAETISDLVYDNSAAIVNLDTRVTNNSNAIVTARNLANDNSNAIVGWIQDTSNVMVSTYNLVVQNSWAIENLDERVVANSNAIVTTNNLALANSNALIGWVTDTSNAVFNFVLANSNAIVTINTLNLANSYAIVATNQLSIANSWGVISVRELAVATSYALLANQTLDVETSNAVVTMSSVVQGNSNAIVGWIRDTSNAVAGLLVATSQAASNARAEADRANTALLTVDHGPAHIHMSGAMTMSFDTYVSPDHQLRIHTSGVLDGAGHAIKLGRSGTAIDIDAAVTVTLANVVLKDFADARINLGAGAALYFGQNVVLELESGQSVSRTWTFAGYATIKGNAESLNLGNDQNYIVVLPNAGLTLKDLYLTNVRDNNLRCMGAASSLTLENAWLQLASDYTFSSGSIAIASDVHISGTSAFNYTTFMGSTINSGARLALEMGSVFNYAPSGNFKNLLIMADSSSQLRMTGATLVASTTAPQLTKGKLIVDGVNEIQSAATVLAEGVVFGDGTPANDLLVEILPGAGLEVTTGFLHYNNAN